VSFASRKRVKTFSRPRTRIRAGGEQSIIDYDPNNRAKGAAMTTRKRIVGAFILLLLGAVFLAGYWPEHQRRVAAERETSVLRARESALDDRLRASQVHAGLLDVIDAVEAMNYGQAKTRSSALFDRVRTETSGVSEHTLRSVLEEVLAERDGVTAALAKGDAAVLARLRASERKIREVLLAPLSP
jgi:hypothetical protein